jgi:hypothetical protein
VVANFSQARAGTLADRGFGGVVGGDLLRRFTVTFDYPARRLLLDPNAAFDEPSDFDLSGLFLTSATTARPALRRAFRRAPGDERTLVVARDGEPFERACGSAASSRDRGDESLRGPRRR